MSDGTLKEAVIAAASSPNVAMGVSAATTFVSGMAMANIIHGVLVNLSMASGVIVTLLLCRVHWMKYKLLKRAWDRPDGELPRDL